MINAEYRGRLHLVTVENLLLYLYIVRFIGIERLQRGHEAGDSCTKICSNTSNFEKSISRQFMSDISHRDDSSLTYYPFLGKLTSLCKLLLSSRIYCII